ncbi:SCP-like extracellular [[Leptolyngbya] sp. PCC 7376]|uniref:CAP domain-containing protein n=1 Tax=[Leptolyngbya] sp. PCC 7376 TaxID=111781 RepID=UPI00029F38DE|nr:CAP domain-containing protein [[Leptolyngbya] sp. PCC 7376]AFY38285.1 SCP-like extracellular [[Leptolyngbya] sp. PCC 7376]
MQLQQSITTLAFTSLLLGLSPLTLPSLANHFSSVTIAAEGFQVGDKVEIFRKDQWRDGEILGVIGTSYRVRYLDVGFVENNVTGDRLKKSTSHPEKFNHRQFAIGTRVIVKGETYREGVITGFVLGGRGGDHYDINYNDDNSTDTGMKSHQLMTLPEAENQGITVHNYDLSTEVAIAEMLDMHNEWRAKVGVTPLTWSEDLEEHSRIWAEQLVRERQMYHRPVSQNPYGENIARSTKRPMTPKFVANLWGSEERDYDYDNNQCLGLMCGHYTQMVWHETTQVGCAMARENDFEIWVCSYDPPGNYVGERPYPRQSTATLK